VSAVLDGPRRRLLAIGLDGADLRIVREHVASLPVLRGLLERGRLYEPDSPRALSGAVWPTFYTASPPGEHGIYQHLVWDAERMRLRVIGPDWCWRKPFWADFDARGHRVVVIDVPYSFPCGILHGVEIHDWATHGQTRPLACNRADVARRLDRSPMGRETPVEKTPAQLRRAHRGILAGAAAKGATVADLVRDLDWDFFLVVFGETHRGGHLFFDLGDRTPLREVYEAADRAIGAALAAVDLAETTVVVFSVHGMGPNYAQSAVVRPLLRRINRTFVETELGVRTGPDRDRGLVRYLRDRVPSSIQHAVAAVAPDSLRRWVVDREIVGGLDWSTTPGFALRTDIRSELRLNLSGREAAGILPRGSTLHRRYVDRVRDAFLDLRDGESGAPLASAVVSIADEFPGPRADALPDLAVEWRAEPPATTVRSSKFGRFTTRAGGARGGDHTDRGFAVVAGPAAASSLPALETTTDFARLFAAVLGTGA
jgi:predicted AlkP superfamily phosphohydrolase/phosphomutase